MSDDKKIDEIVELLDEMFKKGTGRVSIKVDDEAGEVRVQTVKSTDCSKNGACAQPTELIEEEQ